MCLCARARARAFVYDLNRVDDARILFCVVRDISDDQVVN